jgi:hypothetical protein
MTGEHPSEARLLLALDRELDAQETARLMDHVRTCAECRAASERFEALSDDVERYCRTWPAEHVPLVANAATRGDTNAATRGRTIEQTIPSQRSWRHRATSASAVLAAAAAVLLLIGAWIALARGGGRGAPATLARGHGHDIRLEEHGASSASTTTVESVTPVASTTPVKPHHRLTAAAAGARASTPRQTRPTYYWALPYSDAALPLSEGSVVMRVRLSREQLQLAGIPLAGIPINDSHDTTDRSLVRAKVLVGADGLPRAISFEQD